MEAESPGAMAAISTKNHSGAARQERRQRLEATKQRVQQAIATMQREFSDVTDPSERNTLSGNPDGTLTITPKTILDESLGDIYELRPTSEGTEYNIAFVARRNGELWLATVIPETGSVTFQRINKRDSVTGVEYVRYVPQHEISQNNNGQGSKRTEPATASIIINGQNGNQELVFKAPVTEPLPTSSHPS